MVGRWIVEIFIQCKLGLEILHGGEEFNWAYWARRSCLTNVERDAIARWDANITMGRRYYYGTHMARELYSWTVQTYLTHMLRPGGGNCVWTARFFPDVFLKLGQVLRFPSGIFLLFL